MKKRKKYPKSLDKEEYWEGLDIIGATGGFEVTDLETYVNGKDFQYSLNKIKNSEVWKRLTNND